MKYRLLLILMFLLNFGQAQAATSEWVHSDEVKARIVAEDGRFGVEVETTKGWHIYYKDPGEAGWGTEFHWDGSQDFTVKEVTFPEYELHEAYGIKTNVYNDYVFFPVAAEFGEKPQIRLNLKGAVCNEICIPFDMMLSLDLDSPPVVETPSEIGFKILLTAFLAGLILNIMPCVLPVLSLKVLSVVKAAGKNCAQARVNFLASGAGIIVSFIVLAGLTVLLKSAGHSVGWGLHFQSPIFVGVLMLVTLVFALSLFGMFHMRVPSWISDQGSNKDSVFGNFMAGVLATLLGTACTAPVLVTAVSFALAGSTGVIFLIFFMMGIGMALPYLVFAVNPNLANFLPKPGNWMNVVKNILGVMLLATSVWLAIIFYNQVIAGDMLKGEQSQVEVVWEQFDEAKLNEYVSQGKVVFVDITADWCVNCQVNKFRVMEDSDIEKTYARDDVVTMRGDMTKPNKILLEYIKKYDRPGIPFNAIYGSNLSEPIILPTLLSVSGVEEAFAKALQK